MKKILLFAAVMVAGGICLAQKKAVTMESPKLWDVLQGYGISNNGKFIYYTHGSDFGEGKELVLVNNKTGQKQLFKVRFSNPIFTEDGNFFVFINRHDSLVIQNLLTNAVRFLPNINNVEEVYFNKQQLLITQSGKQLVVRNVTNNREQVFENIDSYKLSPDKKGMVIKSGKEIAYITLSQYEKNTIVTQMEVISELKFDQSGTRLAFLTKGENGVEIWCYDTKHTKARKLANDLTPGMMNGYKIIDRVVEFSPDGNNLYFMEENNSNDYHNNSEQFQDLQLQIFHYQQLFPTFPSMYKPSKIISVVSTGEIPVIKHLTKPGYVSEKMTRGNKYLLAQSVNVDDESYWNTPVKYWLVSLETGIQKEFTPASLQAGPYRFLMSMSPDENSLVWHNSINNHVYSYEMATGAIRNVTKDIPLHRDIIRQVDGSSPFSFDLYRRDPLWIDQGKAFWVFDKYDLWQIDPLAKVKPVNLTKGYGRENGGEFQFAVAQGQDIFEDEIKSGQTVLLRVLETKTKKNGIWSVQVGSGNISKGSMDDCLYQWNVGDAPVSIHKAKETGDYLVTKQTAEESKNIYVTKDFKTYKKVSNIAPERDYHWMTSELITYTLRGGASCQGILYKPKDFNPDKKYPVIFFYYQGRSNELHQYQVPRVNGNMVDIPLYINKGYLVFVPDIINDKPGEVTRTTLNSAESAFYHLSQFSWFDSAHVGLNGHSFGGFETNILATNSKLFKAAVAAAGPSNIISQSGSIRTFDGNGLSFSEKGQHNLNATVWERPDLYIENSPVFQTNKAVTPLLLLHGTDDGAVAYDQAHELFQAFRRLQKPAWLFAYKDGGHGVTGSDKATLDLSIRVQQFFDHYLKGEPAPQWLIDGSYSRELNKTGKCSDNCPVCAGSHSGM